MIQFYDFLTNPRYNPPVINGNFAQILQWTEAQRLGLAPDTFTIRAGRGSALPEKWHSVGRTAHAAWGLFPNRNKPPFQSFIQFDDMTMACSCNSQKSPCRHTLALLLLLAESPDAFDTAVSPPAWLTAQQKRHQQQKQRRQSAADMKLLHSGMKELNLWLRDLVRQGLADLPGRSKLYWTQMADRMIDAEAPAIAHTLRDMTNIPVKQADWPERILRRLGRLFFIVQGFNQWDHLPPETQADLKTAVGRLPTRFDGSAVNDNWLVLGRTVTTINKRPRQTTWLWGSKSNRPARLLQEIRPGRPVSQFATGTLLTGDLQFTCSSFPLTATFAAPTHLQSLSQSTPDGYTTISAAMHTYAQAKAANPWLESFPFLLSQVKLHQPAQSWQLIDASGFVLPLKQPLLHHWHLAALSNGRFLPIFGTWDGSAFTPLSVHTDSGLLDLHILRGVK